MSDHLLSQKAWMCSMSVFDNPNRTAHSLQLRELLQPRDSVDDVWFGDRKNALS